MRILLPLLLLAACDPDPTDTALTATATVDDDVVTVVVVEWTTETPGASWVEFGIGGAMDRTTPKSAGDETDHRAVLLGLPPLTEVSWRAVTETEEGRLETTGTTTTGQKPADIPDYEVTVNDPSLTSSEPYLFAALMSTPAALLLLDREGRVIWYRILGELDWTWTMLGRLGFGASGNDLWYLEGCWNAEKVDCAVHRVSLEGDVVDRWDVPGAHHAFVVLPDGTLSVLTTDARPWYDEELGEEITVYGDALVEVAPDGTQSPIWSSWDWAEVTKGSHWGRSQYDTRGDWTHGNYLTWNEATGTYLLSMAGVNTLVEIERATGDVVRTFGEDGIVPDATSTPFNYQHHPNFTEAGTLLLTSTMETRDMMVAVEYELDEAAGKLHQVWSYGEGENLVAIAGGQAIRLANGNTLVSAGITGTLREVTPEGEVAWEAVADLGFAWAWTTPVSDLYAGQ